jgi:uncharacterized protein
LEFDTRQSEAEKRSFRIGIVALVLLLAAVVTLQIAGARFGGAVAGAGESDRELALRTGDMYARFDLAWPSSGFDSAMQQSYAKSLPWPSAYRRLGVLKEFRGKSGRADFEKLDSAARKLGMAPKQIAELRREKAMWLRLSGHKELTAQSVPGYVSRIRALNLGPLDDVAVYEVYRKAGQAKTAERILESARARERSSLTVAICLIGLLILGGFGGFIIATVFLVANVPRFAAAPRSWLSWTAGVSAFVVYLASYIGLSAAVEIGSEVLGARLAETWVDASYLGLVIVSAAVAFALGMWVLTSHTHRVGLDWREIGYRTRSIGRDILTGLVGFLSALPFLFIAAIVTWGLAKTVFKHIPTPQQPFEDIISQGGALSIALTFIAASVVAPIVEETFFRGVLYTTLRGRMGVWGAVILSSAMFAVVHPLPGGFVIIFTLACVFALMRERTGSLLPSMVCHSVYNTVQLLVLLLLF